jgi:hypothetical protein
MLFQWIKKYWGNLLLIAFATGGILAAFYMAGFFKAEEQGVRSQKPIIFCQPQNAPPQQQKCFFTSHVDIYLTIKIWGEEKNLPFEKGDLTKAHTHADRNKIHWHSLIPVDPVTRRLERELTLGEELDDLSIPFDKDRIFNFKNGDIGPAGKAGTLKMFVEGKPNFEFRDFVTQPEQHISLIFDDTSP